MEVLSIVCQTEKKVESSGSVQMKINGTQVSDLDFKPFEHTL